MFGLFHSFFYLYSLSKQLLKRKKGVLSHRLLKLEPNSATNVKFYFLIVLFFLTPGIYHCVIFQASLLGTLLYPHHHNYHLTLPEAQMPFPPHRHPLSGYLSAIPCPSCLYNQDIGSKRSKHEMPSE